MPPIRNKAISLLSKRAYFSKQLSVKLKEKGYPPSEIDEIIADFTKRGWLNDRELAIGYVRRLKERGYGPRVIQMKLKEKAGSIEVPIEASEEPIKALIKKKYARRLPEEKEKVIAALLRRGHSYDLIKKSLDGYDEELCSESF